MLALYAHITSLLGKYPLASTISITFQEVKDTHSIEITISFIYNNFTYKMVREITRKDIINEDVSDKLDELLYGMQSMLDRIASATKKEASRQHYLPN